MNAAKTFDIMVDAGNRLQNHFFQVDDPFYYQNQHIVDTLVELKIDIIGLPAIPHKPLDVIKCICDSELDDTAKVFALEGLACDMSLLCIELGFLKLKELEK